MFRATLCSSSGGQLYEYNFWYNHSENTCEWSKITKITRIHRVCIAILYVNSDVLKTVHTQGHSIHTVPMINRKKCNISLEGITDLPLENLRKFCVTPPNKCEQPLCL